ncbi:MAG TPA: hypothetical protein PLI18_02695 [Pirellulaceae bacterium]|nr:hypothetical protein [Pirellulaceae bacterium]
MTQNPTFWRKVVYVSLIGLLAIPLSLLGRPAVKGTGGGSGNEGGVLARTRTEHDLSQSSLGEIDPASETMKLASLGMKGIAVMILWDQANTFKDEENWEAFSATVNQIIKLQPNFIEVWEYQAHNISYNVSVEFDDYQGRYDWVKKGFEFLTKGLAYNRRSYDLLRSLGMFFGMKIARSDESLQFRNMFRKDVDYHEELATHVPMDDRVTTPYGVDNWLVARQWFLQAENKVREGVPLSTNTSHLMFYREAPSQFRNAAMDLEKEFRPEEPARRTWEEAFDAWNAYGNRSLKTSWETQLRLNDKQVTYEKVMQLQRDLDAFAPGERERLAAALLAELPPENQAAFAKPAAERTPEELFLAVDTAARIRVEDSLILEAVPAEQYDEAYRVLRQLQAAATELQRIEQYRSTVNYLYWLKRSQAEQTPTNLQARAAIYDAQALIQKGVLTTTEEVDPITGETTSTVGGREKYEEAFALWAEIMREYPELVDGIAADELKELTDEYRKVLDLLGEPFPDPFALDFVFARIGLGSVAEQLERLEQGEGPPTAPPAIDLTPPTAIPLEPPGPDGTIPPLPPELGGEPTTEPMTPAGDGDGAGEGGSEGSGNGSETSSPRETPSETPAPATPETPPTAPTGNGGSGN